MVLNVTHANTDASCRAEQSGTFTTGAIVLIITVDKSPLRAEPAPYGVPALET